MDRYLYRDCSPEELAIDWVTPGVYLVRAPFLRTAIEGLSPDNAQGELYLTDVVAAAAKAGGVVEVKVTEEACGSWWMSGRARGWSSHFRTCTKMVLPLRVLARVRVALRRAASLAGAKGAEAAQLRVGELMLDLGARRVFLADSEIHLTPIEYRLLTTLARHAGKVLTHRFLLKEVWGVAYAEQAHYLRIFMANLRRKIEADPARPRYLLTEQGVGYRLTDE